MKRLRVGVLLPSFLVALSAPASASVQEKWPRWPTELDAISARLNDADTPLPARHAALRELAQYASPVIEPLVIKAALDPADDVRQAALELCLQRELVACIPAAHIAWSKGHSLLLRMVALKVLALQPDISQARVLFSALRHRDGSIRSHAAQRIGLTHFSDELRDTARSELMNKLADPVASVRRSAVRAIGQLGPGSGALTLVRLLEDADPAVREATAQALDRLRDPRVLAAMGRALDRGGDSRLARNLLRGFSNLPTPAAEPYLIRALDDPPGGLQRDEVAHLLGLRRAPTDPFIEELILRLEAPTTRNAALVALFGLGSAARPALERAYGRGLAPDLAAEVDIVIRAHQPDALRDEPRVLPSMKTRAQWRQALADPDARRRNEALTQLVSRPLPPWLWGRGADLVRQRHPETLTAPILMALANAQPTSTPWDPATWAEVGSYSEHPHTDVSCLGILTMQATATGEARERRHLRLAALSASANPGTRSCTALAAGRCEEAGLLDVMLADPSARVRASAAYATVWLADLGPIPMARLTWLSVEDPSAAVRLNAAFAQIRDPAASIEPARVEWLLRDPPRDNAWPWARTVQRDHRTVVVPTFPAPQGDWWVIVPPRQPSSPTDAHVPARR
ncbi:MAG: HEAT repeat domain-containing protein [Nannocystaceae bacterium]